MTVKTKIITVIALLLILAGGAGVYFYLSSGNAGENLLPDAVNGKSWVFPYTGLKTADENAIKMRPLCVKIPNDVKARPQTNINTADVIYETMVEGGETRLNAIFQSKIPEDVGPVRSARLSDIWIAPQYDGMLFFSGANSQVRSSIDSHNISDMRWSYADSIYFRADNGRGDLHNLHIELDKAYDVAKERDYPTNSSSLKPLHFVGVEYEDSGGENTDSKLDSLDDEGVSGASVKINISGNSRLKFEWNEEEGRYFKWFNDEKHMDTVEDKQVNVANVVVMWADYIEQSKVDAAGSPTYDTNLGGSGNAVVFKNGKRYDCEWRADETTPPRFFNSNDDEVLLAPGNTWIAVPPAGTEVSS